MKNLIFFKLIFLFVFILNAAAAFADVTGDVANDMINVTTSVDLTDDGSEDARRMIEEVLNYGIDSEVANLLNEIGSTPDQNILKKVLQRYTSSNLVTTKIDFVKYFAKLSEAPTFLVDTLYNDASDDFVDKQLQVALLSCFAKIGGLREGRYMLELVDSDDRMLSYTASQGLSTMEVPELVPDILARLKKSDEDEDDLLSGDIKSRLTLALGQSNAPEVIEYLRKISQDTFANKFQVAYAMDGLAKQKDLDSLSLMEQNLGHSEVKVQEYAAHALSLYECEQVVPILNKMLLHNNETVRVYACEGLARNKVKSAIQGLSYKYRRDSSAKVKNAALLALLQLDGEGVNEIRKIFDKQKMSSSYLGPIADGVAKFPTEQNVAYLTEIYSDAVSKKDKKLIDAVANKIIYCKSNLADKIITMLLDSEDYLIRMGGIKGVANIENSGLFQKLQDIATNDTVAAVADYAKKVLVIKGK